MDRYDPAKHELRKGDVLLFGGTGGFSQITQMIDGCEFDHSGLVWEPAREPSGPLVRHVTFGHRSGGPAEFPLSTYRDEGVGPTRVLVRRHRIEGPKSEQETVADNVYRTTTGYSMDRLISIILMSLTRFSPALAIMETTDPKRARAIAFGIYDLYRSVPYGRIRPHDRVCSEFIADCFDSYLDRKSDVDGISHPPYLGLVLPHRPLGGLLAWIVSGIEFEEFMFRQLSSPAVSPGIPAPISVETAFSDLHQMYVHYGVSFHGPPTEVGSANLKAVVVEGASRLVELLGLRAIGTAPNAPELWPTWAARLLEHLLTHRWISTASDIVGTRSLFDVYEFEVPVLPKPV